MRLLARFSFAALALFCACPALAQSASSQHALPSRDRAVVHAQQLAMPPKAARAFAKGFALLHKYEFQASLPYFRKAIELAPDLFPPYHNLGLAEYNLGHFVEAEENFQKAIDISKGSFAPAFFGLSVVFYTRGQFNEAERTAQQGLLADPGSAAGKYSLALAQYSLGDAANAQRNAVEAVRIDSGLAEAHLLLAHVHDCLHDPKAVIADVNDFFEIASHDEPAVHADAVALRQRAQQELDRASLN